MNAFLFTILFSLLILSQSIYIDLLPGDLRCIGQELDQEDSATFSLGANSKATRKEVTLQKLTVTVTDPDGKSVIDESLVIGARTKEFRPLIKSRGVHDACFELRGGKTPVRVFFHVDFQAKSAQTISLRVAGLEGVELSGLEAQLQGAEHSLLEISQEIDFARRQETLLREAGDRTSSQVEWFGLLSIFILVVTSLWQIIYLRYFFTSKKLL